MMCITFKLKDLGRLGSFFLKKYIVRSYDAILEFQILSRDISCILLSVGAGTRLYGDVV